MQSGEFVNDTSEYVKKRMDMFNKHTKELAEFLPSQLRGETKTGVKLVHAGGFLPNGTKLERNAANGTLALSDLHIRAASAGIEGLLSGVNRKAFARREVFSV